MRTFPWVLTLVLTLGLGALLTVPPSAAEEPASPERIAQLIKQLGSDSFEEREKATQELDQIGPAAVDALRKAAAGGEIEVRTRAEQLLHKAEEKVKDLERKALAKQLLTPTRVHLVYKEIPVTEAVEDFARKSSCTIQLFDPENKLADRKITLDTGDVTFWEAFDQFCVKAGVTEATWQDIMQVPGAAPGAFPGGIAPNPGIPIQIRPIQIQRGQALPIRIQAVPVAPPPPKPDDPPAPPQEDREPSAQAPAAENQQAEAPPARAVRPAQIRRAVRAQAVPAQRAQGGGAAPAAGPAARPARRVPVRVPQSFGQPGVITLKDGKAETVPTCYSGSARVRVLTGNGGAFGPVADGEFILALEVRTEPRIPLQSISKATISKALDNKDQNLAQLLDTPTVPDGAGVPAFPGAAPGGVIRVRPAIARLPAPVMTAGTQVTLVRLKKGAKESKTLKELTGSVTVDVVAPPEIIVNADKVASAKGKTFKGKEGGYIKILDVKEADDNLTVKVEMQVPEGIIPEGGAAGGPINGINFGQIQVLPALPPQAVPVPAPGLPPPPALPPGGGFQFQAQAPAAPPQAGPVQVQIQIGPAGGGFVTPFAGAGLTLVDDKGKAIPLVEGQTEGQFAAGQTTYTHTMKFKLAEGQKPAGLVFKGSRVVTIDIPFSLKDVPVK